MRQHFIAERLPYSHPIGEGIIRLRTGGTVIGYDIIPPGHETASDAEVLAACERFGMSLAHFGTGDFLHLIAHRVPATSYPEREFPNRARLPGRPRACGTVQSGKILP